MLRKLSKADSYAHSYAHSYANSYAKTYQYQLKVQHLALSRRRFSITLSNNDFEVSHTD
jgi:hypothetical protein